MVVASVGNFYRHVICPRAQFSVSGLCHSDLANCLFVCSLYVLDSTCTYSVLLVRVTNARDVALLYLLVSHPLYTQANEEMSGIYT